MRKLIFSLIALVLVPSVTTFAQSTGEIHGRVIDESSGEPIPFVSVSTWPSGTGPGTECDIDGRFKLKPLNSGTYTLRFVTMNFVTVELADIHVMVDKITTIGNVTMNGTELPTFVVEERIYDRKLLEIDNPAVSRLMAKEFKRDPNRGNLKEMISKNFAGVTKSRDGNGLIFRGSRSDAMAYFIDGVKVTGDLSGVASSGISSISVYTGALPARYGDVTGGVIVIETKSYQEAWARRKLEATREAEAAYELE